MSHYGATGANMMLAAIWVIGVSVATAWGYLWSERKKKQVFELTEGASMCEICGALVSKSGATLHGVWHEAIMFKVRKAASARDGAG